MLSAQIDQSNGTTICVLAGELDAYTAAQLRQAMAALAGQPSVLIDLGGVVFIDSSGLGALVGGIRRVRELGGEVLLCAPTGAVSRVLRVAGLQNIVTIAATRVEALATLATPPAAATSPA